jgi:hypothetical protein
MVDEKQLQKIKPKALELPHTFLTNAVASLTVKAVLVITSS